MPSEKSVQENNETDMIVINFIIGLTINGNN